MKILALAADQGGCAKYRVYEPARVTSALGVEIEVSSDLPVHATQDPETKLTTVWEVQTDVDAIIFQRPLDNAMHSAIVQAKRQGIATIVEMDDDLAATHVDNYAYPYFNRYSYSNIEWLWKACSEADFIVSSTPALQRYAVKGKGAVLRNYVPESIFNITPRYERIDELSMLGWSGSVATHPHDLQVTKGVIGRLVREKDLGFSVVGSPDNVMENLGLYPGTPMYTPGWADLDDYYEMLANSIDIGVVPLEKSTFNTAKSYLKGLEMAAVGIPFVASNSYEYEVFASYGIGQTARNPSEWRKHLTRLVDNPDKTRALAVEYRDKIRSGYTYEQHAPEWIKAWEEAIEIRKNSHD